MPYGTGLFLDTSIIIASFIHSPKIKKHIENRIKEFTFACTGMVVKKELKHRFFNDIKYLYNLSRTYNAISDLNRRIDALPKQQYRKFRICFQTLITIDEMEDEQSRLDRLRYYTKYLLDYGMDILTKKYCFLSISSCFLGKNDIQKTGNDYDMGPSKCSRVSDKCKIHLFLSDNQNELIKIQEHLRHIDNSEKTVELRNAEEFIDKFKENPHTIQKFNPCSTVADLLIALESKCCPSFYTINKKESQHYCRVLNQNLIVRPTNPDKDDEFLPREPK